MRLFCMNFFGVLLVVMSAEAKNSTVVSKIFHHAKENNAAHSGQKNINCGEVTFVFSDGLVVNQLKNSSQENGQVSFFVPYATISSKLTKKIVSNKCDMPYSVLVKEVSAPMNGLRFDISYDPNCVLFSYDMFQRVTGEKKLVFSFFDKQLIRKIQNAQEEPAIMVASLQPVVLIDCGHGGADPGVIGCNKVTEKEICLQVGQKIASMLKKKGIQVCLTREKDEYISVDKRIVNAHAMQPSIFVSLHANAAKNENVSGIETYYFDPKICSLLKNNHKTDLGIDFYQDHLLKESKKLAEYLQSSVCNTIKQEYAIIDRHCKAEPLQLLMGNSIPSALIEMGFLTNPQEAHLLSQDTYQQKIAWGIMNGIIHFISQCNVA